MTITLNGRPRDLDGPTVVADLVEAVCGSREASGVAVALNGSVVPRSQWAGADVLDADQVEVVTAVQGG